MKVIINKVLPFGKNYYAINLFGVLFAKGPCDKYVINHESIHTEQIKDLLVIGFYLWYLIEWMIKWIKYGDSFKAYKNISFEREAYRNEYNLNYIPNRRRFSFLKYM